MDLNQRIAQVQQQLGALEQIGKVLSGQQASLPPVQAPVQQSSTTAQGQLTVEQATLVKWFDEFVVEEPDIGKQLVAGLGKFHRFAQSKVAKQQGSKPQ